ncbi:MAG: hypothetical protein GXP41_05850 [Chloroflexi bacterium]|nr:hypothetical protein [Chloroflexota bacterium]
MNKYSEDVLVLALGTFVLVLGTVAVAFGLISGSGWGIDNSLPVVRQGTPHTIRPIAATEVVQLQHTPLPTVTQRPTLTPPGIPAGKRTSTSTPAVPVAATPNHADSITSVPSATPVRPPPQSPTAPAAGSSPTPTGAGTPAYPPPPAGTPTPMPTSVSNAYPGPAGGG